MASQFASIPSALLIQTVHVTRPVSRKNAEIPASARAALIPSVKPLITNRSVLVQPDSRATRECSAQFRLSTVMFLYLHHVYFCVYFTQLSLN